MGWIVIPDWRRFQHYKDREPKWIKVYTRLHSDPEWLALPMHLRGLLVSIWLLYAASAGQVPASPAALSHSLGTLSEWDLRKWREDGESVVSSGRGGGERPVRARDLQRLEQAGFLTIVASKPLALRYPRSKELRSLQNGAPREHRASGARQDLLAAADRFAAGWNGGSSEAFDHGLDELEQLTGSRLGAGDRYRLWERALKGSHLH